jgi:Bacterial PH domain
VTAHRAALQQAPEHEFEAEPGLPQALPRDETVLWRGSPLARVMAREAMHTRILSIYFAVLLAWRGATVLSNGGNAADAALAILWLLPLAVLAIGALTVMGWLIARTTVYTVTDKRVVMRIGVVLSITFNLPFSQIESAALRLNADGTGDLTLALNDTANIAYVHLWPHARPW